MERSLGRGYHRHKLCSSLKRQESHSRLQVVQAKPGNIRIQVLKGQGQESSRVGLGRDSCSSSSRPFPHCSSTCELRNQPTQLPPNTDLLEFHEQLQAGSHGNADSVPPADTRTTCKSDAEIISFVLMCNKMEATCHGENAVVILRQTQMGLPRQHASGMAFSATLSCCLKGMRLWGCQGGLSTSAILALPFAIILLECSPPLHLYQIQWLDLVKSFR